MNYLTKDDILQREDILTRDVEVPEWGGTVRVRGMSGVERDKFEASLIVEEAPAERTAPAQGTDGDVKTSMDNVRAKLCAWCIVDGDGARMFADADVVALGAKSAAALDRVFDVAQEAERHHRGRRRGDGPGDGRAPFRRNVYSLAHELHMSPGRFLAEHTSREISEWMAWHKLEAADQQQAADKAKVQNKVRGGRRRSLGWQRHSDGLR